MYANDDESDRSFRHLVYSLDGLEERNKMLVERMVKDEHITDKEFQQLEAQMDGARTNTKDAISFIIAEIRRHQYNIT